MEQQFSVLMSLYIKEKPEYFKECMESILNQSVLPNEIVIVKDGPLTAELENALQEYVDKKPEWYTIVPLEKNGGLGIALAQGILHCKNELVARMDTDDVVMPNRFEKQLKAFEEDPELDICGGHILEFEGNVENIVAQRKVPVTDQGIKKFQKRRTAFNHMTVMYKKSAVLKAGNYQSCLLIEDTLLWVNMIMSGAKCGNIDDYLVYVRVGADLYARRGGWSYFKKYKVGRKRLKQSGYIGFWDYHLTLIIQFFVAMAPQGVRKFIFKTFLRS